MPGGRNNLSPFSWLLTLLSAGFTFYLMFNYIGPFQWLAELQLRWFGSYEESITFLVTFLLICGALALVMFPIRKFMSRFGEVQGIPLTQGLVFQLIGLGFVFFGYHSYHKAALSGPRIDITAAQLESGQRPAGDYVHATGYPFPDDVITFDTGSGKSQYLPVVSQPGSTSGSEVRLFVKLKEADSLPSTDQSAATFDGMLSHADLPGAVRVAFQKQGSLSDDNYEVLEPYETPETKKQDGKTMMWVGGVFAALGVVLGLIGKLRSR